MDWDWDNAWTPSGALEMQITPQGALLATNSISRAHLHLAPDGMLVLLSFAGGVPAREALARLEGRYKVDRAAFEAMATRLIAAGLVVPVAQERAASAATGHFADVLHHVAMLGDDVRVAAYQAAIGRQVRGKRVLEIGCGTGILSMFAARAGASRVIAVEESAIAGLAEELFALNGCTVELVRRSSRDVTLSEPVNVIVHELLGGDPLAEGLLPSVCDARRRLLAPGGRLLPGRLELLCVGVAVTDAPHDRPRALAEVAGLQGRYGLDFAPLGRAVEALPARPFIHTLGEAGYEALTEECVLHDLDLMQVEEDACAAVVERSVKVLRPGVLAGVLLYFRAHLDERGVLSNPPDAAPTHWGRRITAVSRGRSVRAGDEVRLVCQRETSLAHERLVIDLE